jgi:hypothetical protein
MLLSWPCSIHRQSYASNRDKSVQRDALRPDKGGRGQRSEDGAVVTVSIAQVGPWTGSNAQLASLQEKIHNYVGSSLTNR